MAPPPSLQQRLYAQSGKATLADLPWLYGAMEAERAAKAAAQGSGKGLAGEPGAQQLDALEGAGGGAPGTGTGGGGGLTFPSAEAVSSPGRSGSVNTLRSQFSEHGGDSGPSGYGGGVGNQHERYSDMARRGTADFTAENIAKALGFGLSLSAATPMTVAAGELAKSLGFDTGMGLPEFTGYAPIKGKPKTLQEYLDAVAMARSTVEGGPGGSKDRINDAANVAGQMAANSAFSMGNPVAGGVMDALRAGASSFGRGFRGGGGGRFDSHGNVAGGGGNSGSWGGTGEKI